MCVRIYKAIVKKMKNIQFGEHITIDGYGGDPKLLNNKKGISFALSDLVKKLKSEFGYKSSLYW